MKALSSSSIELFKSKYPNHIGKETETQILICCPNPNHKDSKRSAVLYKDSGVVFCAVCGKINIEEVVHGKIEYEYKLPRDVYRERIGEMSFPDKFREAGYFRNHKGDLVFASFRDGVCVGLHERVWDNATGKRIYRFRGNSQFRQDSKYITESTTDAIRLYEAGVDAGSICSVANWSKVKKGQIYIPQIDSAGIEAGLRIQRRGVVVMWWNMKFTKEELSGIKDICDLDDTKFNKVLKLFNVK